MAKGYIFDKFFNRKIEGETNLATSEEVSKKVSKIEVSNIQSLTDTQLNELKVGDVVQKITGEQKHCYIVTYKQEQHGICLSYFDAGYLETVSYDYTAGHWVYNSTDVCNVAEQLAGKVNLIETEDITSVLDTVKEGDIVHDDSMDTVCTICYVTRSEDGDYVSMFVADGGNDGIRFLSYMKSPNEEWEEDSNWSYVSDRTFEREKGTKLYKHDLYDEDMGYHFYLITTLSTPLNFTTLDTYLKVYNYIRNIIVISFYDGDLFNIQFSGNYFYKVSKSGNDSPIIYNIDDWNLSETTDTVTSL